MDWAVLMMAYGGPNLLEDVEPYLLDVRGGRETPPELVEEVRERYAQIGGRSPLLEITRQQASALEVCLNESSSPENHFRVFVGMRHWHPYIRAAVEQIHNAGHSRVVGICMAPYYSRMSIGAYAEKLRLAVEEVQSQDGASAPLEVRLVEAWNTHPGFIQSVVEKVQDGLAKFSPGELGRVYTIFTAHSLPVAIINQGDPYADQFKLTAGLVAEGAGLAAGCWQTGYQSAGAQNTRWLGPSLEEVLAEVAEKGEKYVLVAPIGFVADHVEILYDVDILAKSVAEKLGIHLERTESPNASPTFIQALTSIIEEKVK
jgi:protoporphyrin/coproporphyrin ferrochelatase